MGVAVQVSEEIHCQGPCCFIPGRYFKLRFKQSNTWHSHPIEEALSRKRPKPLALMDSSTSSLSGSWRRHGLTAGGGGGSEGAEGVRIGVSDAVLGLISAQL